MYETPLGKRRSNIQAPKALFPPLPYKNIGKKSANEDTPSACYTDVSFETPSTRSSSPGRYAWSISSKKESVAFDRTSSPFTKARLSSPSSTQCSSPGRYTWSLSSKKGSLAFEDRTPSPFAKARLSSPVWRNSPTRITRYHSFNKPNQTTMFPIRKTNSAQSPLIDVPTKEKKSISILDLTDSEDEVESVVDDSSLRQLFRHASYTLSSDGKMFEEESYLELQPSEQDQDYDGLEQELMHLDEDRCNADINDAMDKIAYRHPSTSRWRDKFPCHSNSASSNQELETSQTYEEYESIADKIIGLCIC